MHRKLHLKKKEVVNCSYAILDILIKRLKLYYKQTVNFMNFGIAVLPDIAFLNDFRKLLKAKKVKRNKNKDVKRNKDK